MEIEDLTYGINYEIEKIKRESFKFFDINIKTGKYGIFENNYNSYLKYKKSTKFKLEGGNIFINFIIIFFRNPIIDFSYINTIGVHYDTLDKFWDKKPYTLGSLGTDIVGISSTNSFLFIKGTKWYEKSFYDLFLNYKEKKLHFSFFFNFINTNLKKIKKASNSVFYLSTHQYRIKNFKLNLDVLGRNFYIKLNKLLINNDYYRRYYRIYLNYNNVNIVYNNFKKINDYSIENGKLQKMNSHEITTINNILYGRFWPMYYYYFNIKIRNSAVYVNFQNNKDGSILIDRTALKELIINKIVEGKLSYRSGIDLINLNDFLFPNGSFISINRKLFKVFFIIGLIGYDDYILNQFKISAETLIILKLISILNIKDIKNLIKILC
jgi:hypothetical protein